MKKLKKIGSKTTGSTSVSLKAINIKAISLNTLVLLVCSLLGSNNTCLCKTEREFNKKVVSKISYFSCAFLNGDMVNVNKVKDFVDSGADITEINKTATSNTSLVYDALFIKNESCRNKIMDILLSEIMKDRYKQVKDKYLNRTNYRNTKEKPATALEKSYNLGYFDIAEKLIEAGANWDESYDCDFNLFCTKVALDRLKNKPADEKTRVA